MNTQLPSSSGFRYEDFTAAALKKQLMQTPQAALDETPFKGFRTAASAVAAQLALDVRQQVTDFEMQSIRHRARRPRDHQKFTRQIEAITSELVHHALVAPNAWLTISLSKRVLGRRDRYRSDIMAETLPQVLESLTASGFVEMIKGRRNPFKPALSRQTTIRAGAKIKDRMKAGNLSTADFGLEKSEEIIILKNSKESRWDKGSWMQYKETAETLQHRTNLQRINSWIESAEINYFPDNESEKPVDIADRRLRRYFNDASFTKGGRMFGGFWQNMKRNQRAGIVIQGVTTTTLDYSQMAPRTLYGLAGLHPHFEDAYAVPGLEDHRDGVKKVLNSMLHTDAPLIRKPQGSRDLLPRKLSIEQIVERIKVFHAPISSSFFDKKGPYLTYIESTIMNNVLLRLMDHGIVGLPIHDAVIVRDDQVKSARTIMLEVFEEVTGATGMVSID